MEIYDAGAVDNVVAGNFVGTDATGTRAIANTIGVFINGAAGNTIGGLAPNLGNVISGNLQVGARIDGVTLGQQRRRGQRDRPRFERRATVGQRFQRDLPQRRPKQHHRRQLRQTPRTWWPTAVRRGSRSSARAHGGNLVAGNLVGVTRAGSRQWERPRRHLPQRRAQHHGGRTGGRLGQRDRGCHGRRTPDHGTIGGGRGHPGEHDPKRGGRDWHLDRERDSRTRSRWRVRARTSSRAGCWACKSCRAQAHPWRASRRWATPRRSRP